MASSLGMNQRRVRQRPQGDSMQAGISRTDSTHAHASLHSRGHVLPANAILIASFCIAGVLWLTAVSKISLTSSGASSGGISIGSMNDQVLRPRCMRYTPEEENVDRRIRRIDPNMELYPTKRFIKFAMRNPKVKQKSSSSHDPVPPVTGRSKDDKDCYLKYDWQKTTLPNCNSIHEMDWTAPKSLELINAGYWRDVWVAKDRYDKTIFKSMRYDHEFTPRNFDRMRRDALVMERLTSNQYIIDIYSFCGTSSFSEYGDGGDISDFLWPKKGHPSKLEKLHMATQGAMSLAALHNFDKEGSTSISHTDISLGQWIKINGMWKLNDFNRARFIAWSHKNNTACTFRVGNNPGKFRSPEEYMYGPQTEKIDVYSFGNILYSLLQEEWPFDDTKTSKAQKLVIKGQRPSFYADVWNSTDPIDQTLKEAMMRCHEHQPSERASAREIEVFLKEKMQELDPGRLQKWGDA